MIGMSLLLLVAAQDPLAVRPDSAPPHHDVLRYQVALQLPDSGFQITASVAIGWRVTSPDPIRLNLDTVFSVASGSLDGVPVAWNREGPVVVLPHEHAAGDTITTVITYSGSPTDGLIIQDGEDGHTFFADNWPDRARKWLASQDHPNDKASIGWRIRAPLGHTVVATGSLTTVDTTDRGVSWTFDMVEPTPVHTMVVGAGRLTTTRLAPATCATRCVPMSVVSYPADSAKAVDGPFRRASEMIDLFTGLFGPFPYRELRHVQSSTRFGGMENSTAIFYGAGAWRTGRLSEATVAHETAHQWFGDAVTQADWHHLWLSEGFATYGAALWAEHLLGFEGLQARMNQSAETVRASAASTRPIIDPWATDLMGMLNSNNYQKGSWVLHSLRGLVGDEVFFAGIREYVRRYRHGNALSRDFASVMSSVAETDLDWYFLQALTQPGYPILQVRTRELGAEVELRITQVQDPAWGLFRIPNLEVRLNDQLVRIDLEGREVVRTFTSRGEGPAVVEVDPDGWWLFALAPNGS